MNPSVSSSTRPAGLGIRVIGPVSTANDLYLISVEANLTKKMDSEGNAISLGSTTGKRQSITLAVSTAGGVITGCGGRAVLVHADAATPVSTLAPGTAAQLVFTNEYSDPGNMYNVANGKFVPSSGLWQITAVVNLASHTIHSEVQAMIYKGNAQYLVGPRARGSTWAEGGAGWSGVYAMGSSITGFIRGNGVDEYSVRFYTTNGTATAAAGSWFQAVKISD